jgi:hypothetical protein
VVTTKFEFPLLLSNAGPTSPTSSFGHAAGGIFDAGTYRVLCGGYRPSMGGKSLQGKQSEAWLRYKQDKANKLNHDLDDDIQY